MARRASGTATSGAASTAPGRGGSILLAVGGLLQREIDLDVLLGEIVERVAAALDADRGTIYLLDPVAGELTSRAALLPEIEEIRLRIGQGIAGSVAQSGEPANLASASGDRRFFAEIDKLTGYRTRSLLAVPLVDREGQVIGVLQLLNARKGRFDADDVERARLLAAETAVAIESTSLWREIRPVAGGQGGEPGGPPRRRYNRIVAGSPAMAAALALMRKAAATDATVLLRGESGTGKELMARAVHVNGARRDGPFVKVDCTTIPATLMENELFGHERGAFTGAMGRTVGKCEAADGGTLFLDEIGELPLPLQGKLLRFIQDRELERVGGTRTIRADVRVVAATHRDLEAMVGRGELREDLYYRVKVVQIRLPSLRERGAEDVLRLAEHFLELYARKHRKGTLRLSAAARELLPQQRWPGNIRELENCIESAVVMCEGATVEPDHLPLAAGSGLVAPPPARAEGEPWRPRPLADVERDHILRTLEACGGNRSRAAALLGIGRNTLLRKITP